MQGISLNQLSFPNRCTLNRIGERAQVRCAFAIQPLDSEETPKASQVHARPRPTCCRDGPTRPFITRHFTIALCHQRDCWKSREWMCGLWLLVIKKRGVTINSRMSSMFSSVRPVCPAGQNDKRTFMWDFRLCWSLSGETKIQRLSCILLGGITTITQKGSRTMKNGFVLNWLFKN